MWSAMAVTAKRTVAKVKSSAIRPRHPEVPNLRGEPAVCGEALMAGYSTRAGIVLKGEDGTENCVVQRFPCSLRNSVPSAPARPAGGSPRYLLIFLRKLAVTENSHD